MILMFLSFGCSHVSFFGEGYHLWLFLEDILSYLIFHSTVKYFISSPTHFICCCKEMILLLQTANSFSFKKLSYLLLDNRKRCNWKPIILMSMGDGRNCKSLGCTIHMHYWIWVTLPGTKHCMLVTGKGMNLSLKYLCLHLEDLCQSEVILCWKPICADLKIQDMGGVCWLECLQIYFGILFSVYQNIQCKSIGTIFTVSQVPGLNLMWWKIHES